MSWRTKIINYVYKRLSEKRVCNENKFTALEKPNDLFKPTQKDKPSPTSNLSLTTAKRYVRSGFNSKYRTMRVMDTNSMEPVIDDNTLLILDQRPKKKDLGVGDIAVYWFKDILIVHRIIGYTSDGRFIFKGDNNVFPDAPVHHNKVVYKYVGHVVCKQDEAHD